MQLEPPTQHRPAHHRLRGVLVWSGLTLLAALAIALALVIATLALELGIEPAPPPPTTPTQIGPSGGGGDGHPLAGRAARTVARSPPDPDQDSKKEPDHMHNQHADLSQTLAEQHIAALREQATHHRPLPVARPPRRQRTWSPRRWWQLLTRRPSRAS